MENLPIAYHLIQNNWVIISKVDLHFDFVCNDQHTKVKIKSPIDLMELKQECTASIEYFTLAAPYVVGVLQTFLKFKFPRLYQK